MRRFRVVFHKIPAGLLEGIWYGIRHPVSGGIALATWSRYTHVEIWVPRQYDGLKLFEYTEAVATGSFMYLGTCYTSTLRDGYDGACERPASEVLKNPDRWYYFEFECEDTDYFSMLGAMDGAVDANKGYDLKLIALWWYKTKRVYDKAKYICTEFVQMGLVASDKVKYWSKWNDWVLWRIGTWPKPLSPKDFAKALPGEIRPLKE